MKLYRALIAAGLCAAAILLAPFARADNFAPICTVTLTCDNVKSFIVANNTTAIVVVGHTAQLDGIGAFNNSATTAYVKIYDEATGTCGSGTPTWRGEIPANSTSGDGFLDVSFGGDIYLTGITVCVTTGIADADTTAPAASTYIVNLRWK